MFDSKDYYQTLSLPKFVALDGTVYVGELIGTETWLGLQAKLRAAQNSDGEMNLPRFNAALDAIVAATFPRPWWKFWGKDARYWIRRLPVHGRMKAIWDFMLSQGKAIGMDVPTIPMPSGKLELPKLNVSEDVSPTAG